ncbi:MAG: SRPBCC domain-containing protein [Fuerstiella sp.]|nr:SRPBCC domain-containing protein [Fuerstiella sp.]
MAEIIHDLPIKGTPQSVFEAVATPEGLINWWPNEAIGVPAEGSEYELQFGPDYLWRRIVTKYSPCSEFEIEMTVSDEDWNGSRIGFLLESTGNDTLIRFQHVGCAIRRGM